MTYWQNYHLAKDLADALRALEGAPAPVEVLAGGTDLLLDLQQGRHAPVHTLVDVTGIPELKAIEMRGEKLFVGAAAPLRTIVDSPLVGEHAQALVEACGLIGGPQVRNTATLGGNVAHALPAGDGTIALLTLGAQAEIADANGCRQVPIETLFAGPGQSTLKKGREVLVGFYMEARGAGEASAFRRVMRPQGVAIAILNLGAWLRREGDTLVDARIAVGPSGPVPRCMKAAEQALRRQDYREEVIEAALAALLEEASFRNSRHRASEDYRRQMAGVLLRDALGAAWARAGDQGELAV